MTPQGIVAVVGTGVIGRSWLRVFARAGYETRAWDPDPAQVERAWDWLKADLKRARREHGLRKRVARTEREHVIRCQTLAEALDGAVWVQESGPESLESRRALFAELDRLAGPRAILASSTAAHDMSAVAQGLAGANRCVVAHPVNPPHVVPLVEVAGGARTDPLVLRRAVRFLERVGQIPVLLKKYVPGFIVTRLEAALFREALHLVASGAASAEAVDTAIRDGLGLRWAVLGPLAVANTDADGGLREFWTRHGQTLGQVSGDLAAAVPAAEAVEQVAKALDAAWRRVPREVQRAWRDDMMVRIKELKSAYPVVPPDEEESR